MDNNNNNNQQIELNNINNSNDNNEPLALQSNSVDQNHQPLTASTKKEIQIVDKNQDVEMSNDKDDKNTKPSLYSKWDPKFYLIEHRDECKIILASMFYKFAFETFSSALGLVVLTRFENDNGVTFLAVMNIIYFLSQSIGSILVSPFVRNFRASRVTSGVMFLMSILIAVFIIIGASTGTKANDDTLGSWNKYLVIPLYFLMGIFVGMIEVSRKLTPRQILGGDNKKLSKLNGLIHLFYEISGTAGSFCSTPLIDSLGPIFALSHQPVFYLIGSIFFFFVSQPFPPATIKSTKDKQLETQGTALRIIKTVGREIYLYFHSLYSGARYILSGKYWWIITTYVLPQVLHRLLENLLFPTFAKKILHKGSLSGILTGGSNFGEAIGSLLVVKFGNKMKNPLWWVRIDAVIHGALWVLVYPPKLSTPTAVACSMIPIFACVSSFWAAGDISLLSFIQSQFPLNIQVNDNVYHKEVNDTDSEKSDISESNSTPSPIGNSNDKLESSMDDLAKELEDKKQSDVDEVKDISDEEDAPSGSPLASVIGFLFAVYAIIISLLSFGLGRVMDISAANGDIKDGFFWISGIGFSVCGALVLVSSFFANSKILRKN